MREWSYIYAAYGLTWVTLVAYGAYTWVRARRAERALAELQRTGGAA